MVGQDYRGEQPPLQVPRVQRPDRRRSEGSLRVGSEDGGGEEGCSEASSRGIQLRLPADLNILCFNTNRRQIIEITDDR